MAINQVKAGAVLNYVIIGLNTLTGLLYTPYMLRCLGQNEYGIYSLVASIIAYLTILDFGFGNAIIRYTAKFRAEGKQQQQWEMFGMFVIVYSVIGLLAFVGGLGLYFNVDSLFDQTMTVADLSKARTMMLLLTFNLAFTFPLSIFSSIISAYENFVFQRLVNIARILLSTAVMIALLSVGFKAIALVVVQTVFNLFTLIINYVYCRRKLKIHIVFRHFNFPFLKEIATYSFWIFLNAIMDRIYWGTGQFVLGSVCGTIAVAIFSVAILLQQMYMTFSYSFTSVLLPRFTQMVALKHNNTDISDLFIKTGRLQASVMFLILSGFSIFGQSFILLWAGSDYVQSYLIALIFFVSLFIPSIQGTAISIIQARNEMRARTLIILVTSTISFILQYFLSLRYGAIGCAIAIGGALVVGQGIACNIYYNKFQNLDIYKFWKEIVKLLYAPIILSIIAYFIVMHIGILTMGELFFGGAIYTLVYIMTISLFGFNKSEINLIFVPLGLIKSDKR